MVARSTTPRRIPVAAATASAITPASAPWRTSPETSPRRNACSAAVARPNSSATASRRATCEPGPDRAASRSNAASTSPTVSVGSAAGDGTSRNAAQPTPVRRCRSSPLRNATPASTSSGASFRSASPSSSALRLRALVSPTAAETEARSQKSTPQSYREITRTFTHSMIAPSPKRTAKPGQMWAQSRSLRISDRSASIR